MLTSHADYARWNGGIIGQGGPTNAQYASIWSQLAAHYKGNSKIIFGIMNEPHDIPSLQSWADSVQAAVNAIRAAGATSQYILIPGSSYSSAQTLPTEAGPYLLKVTDPAGGVSKLIFDVHKYLDSDNSGTHADCVTDNTAVLQTLYNWLQTNGRQALLSETGGGNTQSCFTDLKSELAFVKSHSDRIVGYTAWSAGAFDTSAYHTICSLDPRLIDLQRTLSPLRRTRTARTSRSGSTPSSPTFLEAVLDVSWASGGFDSVS
jgi:endoglucanase